MLKILPFVAITRDAGCAANAFVVAPARFHENRPDADSLLGHKF